VTVDIPLPSNDGRAPQPPQKPQRLFYIDWIRATIIALVVAFHCIDLFFDYTYSAAVYLGIVNQPPSDATRQVAIVTAQLMQVGLGVTTQWCTPREISWHTTCGNTRITRRRLRMCPRLQRCRRNISDAAHVPLQTIPASSSLQPEGEQRLFVVPARGSLPDSACLRALRRVSTQTCLFSLQHAISTT